MKTLKIALLACLGIFFLTACDKDEPEESMTSTTCDSEEMTYTNDIKEILDRSCATAGCHDDNAIVTIGSLSTYVNAAAFAAFGRILGAINQEDNFVAMPIGADKLSDCDIAKITNWVNNGLPQ